MKILPVNPTSYTQVRTYGISNKTKLYNNYACDTVSFTSVPNSYKLKKLLSYGIPDMYSDIILIDPKRFQNILKSGIMDEGIGKVINILSPFEQSLFPIQGRIFKYIKESAKTNPEQTLSDVIKSLVPKHTSILRAMQKPIFEELTKKATKLPLPLRKEFGTLMQNTNKILRNEPVRVPFSTYEFKYNINKLNRQILAKNIPEEISAMKRIIKYTSQLNEINNEKTYKYQLHILRKLKNVTDKSVLSKYSEFYDLYSNAAKRLQNIPISVTFSRKSFLYELNKITDKLSDKNLKQSMLQTALKLPTSRESISAMILKLSDCSCEKIGLQLFTDSFGSIEHLVPASKNGENNIKNYGFASMYLNSERGNKPFYQQLQEHPDIKIYCQKCVDRLIELHNNGTFRKIGLDKNFIIDLKNRIYKISKKKLALNINNLSAKQY